MLQAFTANPQAADGSIDKGTMKNHASRKFLIADDNVDAADTLEAMLVMDGFEFAREIRQQPGVKEPVLIALTGWGQSADKARAGEAGFDHHLVKPVDYDMLMKCLQVHDYI